MPHSAVAGDVIIRVDRGKRPVYPHWVDSAWINDRRFVVLEQAGPTQYALRHTKRWLHPDQQDEAHCAGTTIFRSLDGSPELKDFLGFADLVAIQQLDSDSRAAEISGVPLGWKSVVRSKDGKLWVPFLSSGAEAEILWTILSRHFYSSNPGLLYPKA